MIREVCSIHMSQDEGIIGIDGGTIEVDETFLSHRKYNRGRKTEGNTTILFGILSRDIKSHCKYFKVNSKKADELVPIIEKYAHPGTAVICTDGAAQYHGVEKKFANCVHKVTNHSKGEYVDLNDRTNHICTIESRNRYVKKEISKCCLKNMYQAISVYAYKEKFFKTAQGDELPPNEAMKVFIDSIIQEYPGFGKEGLEYPEKPQPEPNLEENDESVANSQ
ncbi:hypothetical protein HDE_03163 [Halotydeus destructor]|nr:hypothetical protein HDE_03163 [Halotydeus destructor]